jgi:hypothetical protein
MPMPMPSFSLQGDKKRPLTPEEQERQKQLDNDYKAATKKIFLSKRRTTPGPTFGRRRPFQPKKEAEISPTFRVR